MIEDFLKYFWVNNQEIKIYVFLLSFGESIASIISKKTATNRNSIYSYLKSLEEKWLIVSFEKNWVLYFKARDIWDIIWLFEKKERELKFMREKAQNLQNEFEKIKNKQLVPEFEFESKVKYFEWVEEISLFLDSTLDKNEKEILCFWINDYHTDMNLEDWERYTDKRVNNWIKVKSIQPNSKLYKSYKSRDKDELRETRLVPVDRFNAPYEFNIIDDTIAIISSIDNKPVAMEIKNSFLADAMKKIFMLAWEKAKDYDDKN